MIDLTEVIKALFALLIAVLTYVVFPLLKSKLSEEKFALMKEIARTGVYAAEQLYTGSGRGEEKLEYVMNYMKERGYDINKEEVRTVVESCVKDLKILINA